MTLSSLLSRLHTTARSLPPTTPVVLLADPDRPDADLISVRVSREPRLEVILSNQPLPASPQRKRPRRSTSHPTLYEQASGEQTFSLGIACRLAGEGGG